MICFRDQSFCSDAEQCKNKHECHRWFSPEQEVAAKRWWGKDGAPVAMVPFKEHCDKWEELIS